MKCPKCGNEIDGKKKFCNKCGTNVEEFIKNQKEEKKKLRNEKLYKVKKKILLFLVLVFIILVLIMVGLSFIGKKSHEPKQQYSDIEYNTYENEEDESSDATGGFELKDNFELTDDNKYHDDDRDGLTNEKEAELGTSMRNSDTDGDGLEDGEEVNNYKSNPLKYSTSGDGISDYIKVKRDLDIDKPYTNSQVKPERVEVSSNIVLVPNDLQSEFYGGMNQGDVNKEIGTNYQTFNMINFEGTVEYTTNEKDIILLIHDNYKYKEFSNYKNDDGKLTITITKSDNAKDFIITTKEKYNQYLKGGEENEENNK